MDFSRLLKNSYRSVRHLHWNRGLRAGLAVSGAMIVCHLLGKPMGWAALGGFEAILVDNGGPYRSRFKTIATLMLAGTVVCFAGALAVGRGPVWSLALPILMTSAVCFIVTFARVLAQPVASTSVIILVIYFAALGSSAHTLAQASGNAFEFVLGGAWAAALSLVLWPVDPFRPARLDVAKCYLKLAEFTASLEPTERGSDAREHARLRGFEWQRTMRSLMESARTSLGATAARAPSRTIRARNLTVLLETIDMLFEATIRMTELALGMEQDSRTTEPFRQFVEWLSDAELAIARGLQRRPVRDETGVVRCFPPLSIDTQEISDARTRERSLFAHIASAELDASQNIEIACEAVKAVWSGIEARAGTPRLTTAVNASGAAKSPGWVDALRANWTLDSVMMRHAWRMTVVGAVDVALLHVLHLSHGFWLAMTSIIVLQPYQSNTLKKGVERVGGTIAGGILAAVLAVLISSQGGIIAVITITSVLTLATYAVDYAWYCFFLTPTFVLMSLPHLRDWEYSGVRMLTTLLGAVVAVAAMRLLWPTQEHLNLAKLLARSAEAEAKYIRCMLRYWSRVNSAGEEGGARRAAEREFLAPARRACGLASNDAEESIDRLMLEPGFGRSTRATLNVQPAIVPDVSDGRPAAAMIRDHALTFVTYVRRLTQSITTLAVLGRGDAETLARMDGLLRRLEKISAELRNGREEIAAPVELMDDSRVLEEDSEVAIHQMQRMERQVSILERAAAGILGGVSASGGIAIPPRELVSQQNG